MPGLISPLTSAVRTWIGSVCVKNVSEAPASSTARLAEVGLDPRCDQNLAESGKIHRPDRCSRGSGPVASSRVYATTG